MPNKQGRFRRTLIRVISDENLDLYLLGAVALVFTVLGITGISDVQTTSAVVVALLALLAFSQIKSRRQLEQIRTDSRGGVNTFFSREFSADLQTRRVQARELLLIGDTMSRTVHGMRAEMSSILAAGGQIRVLVLDPTDEALIASADRRIEPALGPKYLRRRIMATLDDLASLDAHTAGRLEVRVSSSYSSAGFSCIDATTPKGLVCVQHFEFRAGREAAPIFTLEPSDGVWYQHFIAEAERMWDAGTAWPLSPTDAAARAIKPAFSAEFGPELNTAIDNSNDLLVTGVARHIFVNNYHRRLEKKLLAGQRIRVLLVDPDSPAIAMAANRYYPKRTPDAFRERIEHTLQLLTELKETTGGDLSVRLTTHLISMFQIVTDSALFAEYYIYQDLAKPKFVLAAGADGYDTFRTEAEKLWESARPYDL